MGEWQPIKTAPKDGTRVLITWSGKVYHGRVHPANGFVRVGRYGALANLKRPCWQGDNVEGLISPTHWMPLPEPPK